MHGLRCSLLVVRPFERCLGQTKRVGTLDTRKYYCNADSMMTQRSYVLTLRPDVF